MRMARFLLFGVFRSKHGITGEQSVQCPQSPKKKTCHGTKPRYSWYPHLKNSGQNSKMEFEWLVCNNPLNMYMYRNTWRHTYHVLTSSSAIAAQYVQLVNYWIERAPLVTDYSCTIQSYNASRPSSSLSPRSYCIVDNVCTVCLHTARNRRRNQLFFLFRSGDVTSHVEQECCTSAESPNHGPTPERVG